MQLSRLVSLITEGPLADQESEVLDIWGISLMVSLLLICIVVGHLLEDFPWATEADVAILLGMSVGGLLILLRGQQSTRILRFNGELFFIYLLPPIIFNAGFSVKKKQFFRNFFPIVLYGILGVFISCAIITAGCWWVFPLFGIVGLQVKDYLAMGAIFSATDSVCVLQVLHQDETPLLYSLVFGEGVVNDATSVVLFRAVQKFSLNEFSLGGGLAIFMDFIYLFFVSTALGVLAGLLSAYIIRTLYFGRHSTDREIALILLMAYLCYILAELLHLSGILTVFFCGIVMSHYTWHNVTENSRVTTKHAFATMSFIAETFIFIYVGLEALDGSNWNQTHALEAVGMWSTLLLLTLLGRAAFVFPISMMVNYTRRGITHIGIKEQVIVWWAGLMRGAVSIALAFSQFSVHGDTTNPEYATIIATTMAVVLFSMLVFGSLTQPLISSIFPPLHRNLLRSHSLQEPSPAHLGGEPGQGLLAPLIANARANGDAHLDQSTLGLRRTMSLLVTAPPKTVHAVWRRFDDSYMRPFFGGNGFTPFGPGTPTGSRPKRAFSEPLVEPAGADSSPALKAEAEDQGADHGYASSSSAVEYDRRPGFLPRVEEEFMHRGDDEGGAGLEVEVDVLQLHEDVRQLEEDVESEVTGGASGRGRGHPKT